jgi:hypothetical protein
MRFKTNVLIGTFIDLKQGLQSNFTEREIKIKQAMSHKPA